MRPPENAEIIETTLLTCWLNDRILYCVSKKADRNMENYNELFQLYKKLTADGNKICLLADATNGTEVEKEVRDFLAAELPKYIIAIAFISESAFGRMIANLFLKLKSSVLPMKMFANDKDAEKWLRQHL